VGYVGYAYIVGGTRVLWVQALRKNAKNPRARGHYAHPPMRERVTFLRARFGAKRAIAPTLQISNIYYLCQNYKTMKMKMVGSIYQSNGAGMGLPVVDGRLENHRPDGMTGLQQIAMARKANRYEKKVGMYAEGVVRAEQMNEMNKLFKNC